MSILQKIIATKHKEVADFKNTTDFEQLNEQAQSYTPKGFAKALKNHNLGIIAEIKKASPSKGIICQNFDPVAIAIGYKNAGAACLSVLTDKDYFLGHDEYLMAVRSAVDLPILRKDFMIDESQITHAKAMGADCILLIMACLDDALCHRLHAHAIGLGPDVLIEVHNKDELTRALTLPKSVHSIYGVNNRNLNTFEVSLNTSVELANYLADAQFDNLLVSESGIHTSDDIRFLQAHGIFHYLIGEQFMKTDNPSYALQSLLSDFA